MIGQNIECPDCGKINSITFPESFEMNRAEYKCECGFQVSEAEYSDVEAAESLVAIINEKRDANDKKRQRIYEQLKEVNKSGELKITCACGKRNPHSHMYRCLFCGEFYCPVCAKEHFEEKECRSV